MEVTKVMDELQRLLSGSAIGLEHSRHEDGAVGVALAELLLSVLQVVAQPLMLGRMSGIGSCLAYPWLVAVAARMGDGDVKHHVGAHVGEVPDDDIWYVPCFRGRWQPRGVNCGVCVGEVGAGGGQACFLDKAHKE